MIRHLKIKDKKKRKLFQKVELLKLALKSTVYNLSYFYSLRLFFFNKILSITQQASKTQIRNRCVVTNRARYIFTRFKISRLEFKRLAVKNKLPGVYHKV